MLKKILNRILNKTGAKRYSHVAWIKTWIFNLRCFDFKTAKKLPIFIYNNVDVFHVGKIEIDSPNIYRGMIRIGNFPSKAHNKFKWRHHGTTIFHGAAELDGGCIVEGDGLLEFGDRVAIGESCEIMCCEHVKFCDHVTVGFETVIMDTNWHYTINTETNTVRRKKADVIIGEGTWISSACRLLKGTVIPPNSVIAGGSWVGKDFSGEAPCQIFAGSPAKPVKGNTRRVVNKKSEREIDMWFEQNPQEKSHKLEVEDMDKFCWDHYFRWEKF